MLEVLVTIGIASFALLGLAGMMLKGIQNNNSSFLRTIAAQQAYDFADRMRSNREGMKNGYYDSISFSGAQACPSCNVGSSCTTKQLAEYDICSWNNQNAALLPSGQGTVKKSGVTYAIEVSWDDRDKSNLRQNFTVRIDP